MDINKGIGPIVTAGMVPGLNPFFNAMFEEAQRCDSLIIRIAGISQIDNGDIRKLANAMRSGICSLSVSLAGLYDDLASGRTTPAELRETIRRIDQPLGAQDGEIRS